LDVFYFGKVVTDTCHVPYIKHIFLPMRFNRWRFGWFDSFKHKIVKPFNLAYLFYTNFLHDLFKRIFYTNFFAPFYYTNFLHDFFSTNFLHEIFLHHFVASIFYTNFLHQFLHQFFTPNFCFFTPFFFENSKLGEKNKFVGVKNAQILV